jgi:membrane fusion protein, heavy metal efflux system
MPSKKLFLAIISVLLVATSFWLGRVTGKGNKDEAGSSDEGALSGAVKSAAETVPHTHQGGKTKDHSEEKQEAGGLKLSAEEKSSIGLKTEAANFKAIEAVVRAAGVVKSHPDREAQVSSRVAGKITNLFAKVGDPVKSGQRLAEVQSPEIQKLQVDLLQAENKLVLAKSEMDRMEKLVESKIAAQKELLAAKNQYQAVVNEIEGLTQQLGLLGLSEETIKKVRTEKAVSSFLIFSPLGGVVAERNVVPGESVEPSKVIFKIIDPSVVFVEGDAFEEALPKLKIGQPVRIRLASYPGEMFSGKISRFSPVLDPQKRTLRLWVEVPNPSGKLKPNLFAEMGVVVGGGQEVLAVPLDAIITTEGASFVFVEEKGGFRRADVVLGARDDRFVEVKKGLLPGEQVVTDGKQQVYTKSLMARGGGAALGGHTH